MKKGKPKLISPNLLYFKGCGFPTTNSPKFDAALNSANLVFIINLSRLNYKKFPGKIIISNIGNTFTTGSKGRFLCS